MLYVDFFRHTSPRTSISISGVQFSPQKMPIIQLSDGSTHGYSDDLGNIFFLLYDRVMAALCIITRRKGEITLEN